MHLILWCYILSHFRRGISKFYNGKSKSFTSLADASSVSTVKELAKPVNPYNKKRKNLLANGYFRDLKNNGGGIRRSASSSRGIYLEETLSGANSGDDSKSISQLPFSCRPPLHPQRKRSPGNGSSDSSPPSPPQRNAPWRSFSLSDLQCATAPTPTVTGFEICSGDMDNQPHWHFSFMIHFPDYGRMLVKLKFHLHLQTMSSHPENLIRVFPHIGFSCVMSLMTIMMPLYYTEESNFMFLVPHFGIMPSCTKHPYISTSLEVHCPTSIDSCVAMRSGE